MAWTRALAQLAFLSALPVACALRASSSCLGLSAGAFPLNVDQLLAQSNYSKAQYFQKLRAMGINSEISMTQPPGLRLPNTCLAEWGKPRQHVVFMGDCFLRMSYEAYLRNEGNEAAAKRSTTASHINWSAQTDAPLAEVRLLLRQQHLDPFKDTVVLWMGASLQALLPIGDKRWVQTQTRAAMLENVLKKARVVLPGVRLVWDSFSYVDLPIMRANPPAPGVGRFEGLDAKLLDELSDIDKAVTARLWVPLTQRHWVGTAYRGLQCDGIHADPHIFTHSEAWGCYGFAAYEDLVLQGGLYPACKGHGAPYCLQIGR